MVYGEDYMKPLVTVMIPTYNQHESIEKTIDSILEQTYNNIEIIISDDSPNKLTETLIKNNYKNNLNKFYKGKIIKYIHNKQPKGQVGNYKFMFDNLISGDWVLNVDGDDFLYNNNFIERAMNYVIQNNEIVLVTSKKLIYNLLENKFIRVKNIPNENVVVSGKWLFFNHIFKNIEIPHVGTIFNRKKALEVEFYKYKIPSTDRESLLKLALTGKIVYLNDYYGVWVYHGDNHSQNVEINELLENLKMYDRLYEYAKQFNLFKLKLLFWKVLAKYKLLFIYYNQYDENNKKKLCDELNKRGLKLYKNLLNLDYRNRKK
jgi:glycosyltransferase involved in cell wall biosynthesis